jgi:hypothetical protein
VQAELHERAGAAAAIGARADEASAHFERSIALFEAEVAAHPAARVSARLAEIHWDRGRIEDGLESMERSLSVLLEEEPDEDVALPRQGQPGHDRPCPGGRRHQRPAAQRPARRARWLESIAAAARPQ